MNHIHIIRRIDRERKMDGNNFGSGSNENNGSGQNNGNPMQNQAGNMQPANQYNNYQDNTANNMYYQAPPNNGMENKANGKQIAGLVFGILAICSSCCYGIPGVIFGIVGLILSILGNKENKHGVGIAGLVCSIIGLICGVAMTVYFAAVFAVVFEMIESGEIDMDMLQQMYY